MQAREIKRIRARQKLSQSGFAELLNISLRTLQEWEQGRAAPRSAAIHLLKLADAGLLAKRKRTR